MNYVALTDNRYAVNTEKTMSEHFLIEETESKVFDTKAIDITSVSHLFDYIFGL